MLKTIINKFKINKRYRDIFLQYIHRGENVPLSIGALVVCAFCFVIFLIATFSQIPISHPWLKITTDEGLVSYTKTILYNPQIPVMILIIYILGKGYSFLLLIAYLIIGFFVWPVFVFGGGLGYVHNYLFGYLLGFAFAILISGTIFKINMCFKTRCLGALFGVLAIHICGFFYCIFLAMFKVINFNLIFPIVSTVSGSKFIYDIIISLATVTVAPYIKNLFWVCMKPKADNKNRLKNARKRNQIVSDYINQTRKNYN